MEGILDSWERGGVDDKGKRKKKGEKRERKKSSDECSLLRDSIRLCSRVRLFMNNERVVVGRYWFRDYRGECSANCFVGKRQ